MWNYLFIVSEFSITFVSATAAIITFIQFIHTKNRVFLFLCLDWVFWAISWFLIAFAQILLNPEYLFHSMMCQAIGLIFLIAFVDHTRYERISAFKSTTIGIIGAILVSQIRAPGSIILVEGIGLLITGDALYVQFIFAMFYAIIYIDYFYQTWKNAPRSLKRTALNLMMEAL